MGIRYTKIGTGVLKQYYGGTISLRQLKNEFDAFPLMVRLPRALGGGRVSLYYWTALRRLWDAGLGAHLSRMARHFPKFELRLTGHSMGGALAALAASFIAHHSRLGGGWPRGRRIRLYTFGAVHSGDRRWAEELERAVPEAFRVNNHWDIVPHIARAYVGAAYHHHGTEIWYSQLMLAGHPYRECPEGESAFCSAAAVPPLLWSWLDHFSYFGTFVLDSCRMCAESTCPGG